MSIAAAVLQSETLEGFPLSPQQRRLWKSLGASSANLLSECVIAVDGALDTERLKRAIETSVSLHEALRTRFSTVPGIGAPLQIIWGETPEFWPPMQPNFAGIAPPSK